MVFVYILESTKFGTYYIGCTNDVEKRLKEHNSGISRYTRIKRPWVLKYKETFDTLIEARHREKQIKSWKKRAAIEKLIEPRSYNG